MAQHGKTLWSEKGASESRASHRDRLLNWDGRGGGVPSSPSPERGETSLFGEAAGRQMVGLQRWALGGVYNFSDCSGPMLGRSPSLALLLPSLCPDFFAAAAKDHRELELQPCQYPCGLSAVISPL